MFIEEPALDQADSHRLKVLVAGELGVIDVLDRAAGLGYKIFDLRIVRINGTTGRQTTGNRGTPNAGETAHSSTTRARGETWSAQRQRGGRRERRDGSKRGGRGGRRVS